MTNPSTYIPLAQQPALPAQTNIPPLVQPHALSTDIPPPSGMVSLFNQYFGTNLTSTPMPIFPTSTPTFPIVPSPSFSSFPPAFPIVPSFSSFTSSLPALHPVIFPPSFPSLLPPPSIALSSSMPPPPLQADPYNLTFGFVSSGSIESFPEKEKELNQTPKLQQKTLGKEKELNQTPKLQQKTLENIKQEMAKTILNQQGKKDLPPLSQLAVVEKLLKQAREEWGALDAAFKNLEKEQRTLLEKQIEKTELKRKLYENAKQIKIIEGMSEEEGMSEDYCKIQAHLASLNKEIEKLKNQDKNIVQTMKKLDPLRLAAQEAAQDLERAHQSLRSGASIDLQSTTLSRGSKRKTPKSSRKTRKSSLPTPKKSQPTVQVAFPTSSTAIAIPAITLTSLPPKSTPSMHMDAQKDLDIFLEISKSALEKTEEEIHVIEADLEKIPQVREILEKFIEKESSNTELSKVIEKLELEKNKLLETENRLKAQKAAKEAELEKRNQIDSIDFGADLLPEDFTDSSFLSE